MKRIDLKAFRKANNLTQEQLGDYLGIKKSFISTIESGKDPMPKAKLSKLLSNPYNWDTSMLTQPENPMADEPKQDSLVDYLKSEIEDLKSQISKLQVEKADLLKENAVMEYQLLMYATSAKKERTAEDADGSLSADAV